MSRSRPRPPCRVEAMEPRRLLSYSTASDLEELGQFEHAPDDLVTLGERVLMRAGDAATGAELWTSDRTPNGTRLLRDIAPGAVSSSPEGLFVWNGAAYFSADDGVHGRELWRSDGTPAGTWMLADTVAGPVGGSPNRFAKSDGRLFFAVGNQVWTSNGTPQGTAALTGLDPTLRDPMDFFDFDGRTYFFSRDGLHAGDADTGLWERIVLTAAFGKDPHEPAVIGDRFAFHGPATDRIYVSDGTAAGTVAVVTAHAAPAVRAADDPVLQAASSNRNAPSRSFLRYGGGVLFVGTNPESGAEPWFTDGTPTGTRMLADLRPGPVGSMALNVAATSDQLIILPDGRAMFAADDGVHGRELWVTDGTTDGTKLLTDARPGPQGYDPYGFQVAGDVVFLGVMGGGLARTDGTPARTLTISASTTLTSHERTTALPGGRAVFGRGDGLYTLTGEDTLPPRVEVTSGRFVGVPYVQFGFSEDVIADPPAEAIRWTNLHTGAQVSGLKLTPLGFGTLRVEAPGMLPDGDYRVEIDPTRVTDAFGNAMVGGATYDSFVFAGDVDRDRAVTANDVRLFGLTFNRPSLSADFDGSGLVNIDDFALLCANFGKTLLPPATGVAAAGGGGGGLARDLVEAVMGP